MFSKKSANWRGIERKTLHWLLVTCDMSTCESRMIQLLRNGWLSVSTKYVTLTLESILEVCHKKLQVKAPGSVPFLASPIGCER